MKYALAAVGFTNGDIPFNQRVITDTMRLCAGRADLVLFGESFLQGFDAVDFSAAHDLGVAVSPDDPVITAIRDTARECGIAVSFGLIERLGGAFYSSQLTIGANGETIDLYRRVSPGWKEPFAGEEYREGDHFHAFDFLGSRVCVGLCGDLWYEENIREVCRLKPDVVWWPVYTDFAADAWNAAIKQEYAEQAAKAGCPVLYVNSYRLDKADDPQIAKGGAALFSGGRILSELPSGRAGVLTVQC